MKSLVFFSCGACESIWYDKIDGKWLNDAPCVTMDLMAVKYHNKGIAEFCTNWCFEKYGNIKLDTGVKNIPAQNLLRKLGFVYCGKLNRNPYAGEFLVYQKSK